MEYMQTLFRSVVDVLPTYLACLAFGDYGEMARKAHYVSLDWVSRGILLHGTVKTSGGQFD